VQTKVVSDLSIRVQHTDPSACSCTPDVHGANPTHPTLPPHTLPPLFFLFFKLHSIFITWTKIRPPRRTQLSQSSPRNVWQIADGNSPIIIQRTLVNLRCQLNLHHQWDSEVVGLNRIVRACVREDRNSGGLMGKDGLSPLDFGFQFLPDNCARDVSERVSE